MFYRVSDRSRPAYQTGPEMQVLDNTGHGDGLNPITSAGALYGLVPPTKQATRAPGRWNRARIQVRGWDVEYTLNGVQVVVANLDDPEMRRAIADSKFADFEGFAKARRGYLVLQDHGDRVWYRNLKVRPLDAAPGP